MVPGFVGIDNAGLYMGVLNAASVVSQTVINLASGQIVKAKGDVDPAWGMGFGAIPSLLAAVLVWAIQLPSKRIDPLNSLDEASPLLNP